MPSFGVVSPLEQTENVSFQQYATFVEESPDKLDVSRDMFAESPTVIPETPILPPSHHPSLLEYYRISSKLNQLHLSVSKGKGGETGPLQGSIIFQQMKIIQMMK